MKLDLNHLRGEIEEHLKAQGFVVFHGHARLSGQIPLVHWDSQRHPDFRMFLDTATQAGVRLIVFHHRQFLPEYLDDALEQLEAAEMPREDQRRLERRLKDLRAYEGFTCQIELSFDLDGRIYFFNLRTEWYDDLMDIMEEIDAAYTDEDEDDEDGPVGGYFTRN